MFLIATGPKSALFVSQLHMYLQEHVNQWAWSSVLGVWFKVLFVINLVPPLKALCHAIRTDCLLIEAAHAHAINEQWA